MEVNYECWIKLKILHYSLQIGTSHSAPGTRHSLIQYPVSSIQQHIYNLEHPINNTLPYFRYLLFLSLLEMNK